MRAVVHRSFGSPDVLALEDIDEPVVNEDTVVVRVHAASVNPADWYVMRGRPLIARPAFGLRRPKRIVAGLDVAGTIEAVGANVTALSPGDEVFGGAEGSMAELVATKPTNLALKPPAMTFEAAAAIPTAGLTALQALRDHGKLKAGQHVLVNGAAGGVGTFAVQIAKAMGAEVTGVCSAANVEMVRSIGADHVVDYSAEDFTAARGRYDLFVDNVGNRKLSECRRVLKPTGIYVVVGASKARGLLGPVTRLVLSPLAFAFAKQRAKTFIAKVVGSDLEELARLATEGKLTPVIEQVFPFEDARGAFRHLERGHTKGKLVLVP